MKRDGLINLLRRKFERDTVSTAPDHKPHVRLLKPPFDWEEYPTLCATTPPETDHLHIEWQWQDPNVTIWVNDRAADC